MSGEERNSDHSKSAVIFSVTMTSLTLILPFFVMMFRHNWLFRFSFWHLRTEPFLESITLFRYDDPFSTIIFWVPGLYMAFEVYRSRKNEFQSRKRFLGKIFIASVLFIVFCYLVVFASHAPQDPILIPFPYATMLSIVYAIWFFPLPALEPWNEEITQSMP